MHIDNHAKSLPPLCVPEQPRDEGLEWVGRGQGAGEPDRNKRPTDTVRCVVSLLHGRPGGQQIPSRPGRHVYTKGLRAGLAGQRGISEQRQVVGT